MDNNTNNSKLRERVLQKIRAKEVRMHPRFYFLLKMAATIFVALCILVISISIFSFILFNIRESTEETLFNFGPPGWLIFIQLFPWWLMILDVALIALLQWMVHAFKFAYRVPLLYFWGGLFALVLLVSAATDLTRFSDDVLLGAQHHDVPVLGELYEHGMHPPPLDSGACPCVVDAIQGNMLVVHEVDPDHLQQNGLGTASSSEVSVLLPPGTATSSLYVGERLYIVGQYQDSVLHAQGFEKQDHDADDH